MRRFWSNISRPPDEKNEMKTGCQNSRGLMLKHVVAIHDTNNDCNNSRYQPRGPGAAGKKLNVKYKSFESEQVDKTNEKGNNKITI